MKSYIKWWIASMAIAGACWSGVCSAGLYGNDTAATARPIMADGMTYIDQMTPVNFNAWFVFRIDPNQSYAVEVWNPYGKQMTVGNRCIINAVWEADGTTPVAGATIRDLDLPAPSISGTTTQGARQTFIASGSARPILLQVTENGGPPATTHDCAIRVVTTTLVSARWSVNGYSDFIAISNASSATTSGEFNGTIIYFDDNGVKVGSENFTLLADASIQIVKPNGVPIGGATRGGIRIVHEGAPGAVVAHQLWYNPVTNAYIQYPFFPLVHSYARGGI